jgi:hypothetical protein
VGPGGGVREEVSREEVSREEVSPGRRCQGLPGGGVFLEEVGGGAWGRGVWGGGGEEVSGGGVREEVSRTSGKGASRHTAGYSSLLVRVPPGG